MPDMKEIFSAFWRFSTDECAGGKKTTAVAIKLCALILFGCLYGAWQLSPRLYDAWKTYNAAMADMSESVATLQHLIDLQGVRYSARDDGQDYRIGELRSEMTETKRDVAQAGRDIIGLRGDIRRLDEVTVKVGRP